MERAYPAQPMKLGRVERLEFEYIRHGVVALIANWHIAKGQVITPTVGTTRTEEDFCEHINKTIETDPEAGWIFLVDQLNIHQERVSGTFSCPTLSNPEGFGGQRCIRYSLSHWQHEPLFYLMRVTAFALSIFPNILQKLNQIECWFSILVRRLLKRSSFTSTKDLQHQILDVSEKASDYRRLLNRPLAKVVAGVL